MGYVPPPAPPPHMVMPTRPWPNPYRPPQPDSWPKLGNWEKWFAWHPVKVTGSRQWLKFVYRRKRVYRVDIVMHGWWEYGTIFDVVAS
jgi:hypothetical protein